MPEGHSGGGHLRGQQEDQPPARPPGRGRATPRATPCAAAHATSALCSTPVQPCAAPRATSALCSTPHAGKAGDGPDAPHLGPSPSRRWASSATSSGVEGGGWELSSGDTAWGQHGGNAFCRWSWGPRPSAGGTNPTSAGPLLCPGSWAQLESEAPGGEDQPLKPHRLRPDVPPASSLGPATRKRPPLGREQTSRGLVPLKRPGGRAKSPAWRGGSAMPPAAAPSQPSRGLVDMGVARPAGRAGWAQGAATSPSPPKGPL